TLDKFMALFPEIVAYAQQFESKTDVDLIKFVNFHRKANKARERIGYIANMAYRTWLTYTFRFASWYLLFDGKLLHHTHSHGDVLALLEQARCLQAQLEQQSQRWELCRYCLLTAAIRGMGKHQELTQAGLVVNQSIFMNEKGVRYLLTGFNIEAYGEQLEFTRILKDGKLSVAENGKQVIRWADIQQGRYLRHAPNYETSSATGCLA
ncbi:hypothetical protein, partial [Conchiformibius steedae]|uniref:hypothetical protein n=1 Tax=Conchiformibius steedae TaxID=153493 RepID=UPI0026EB749C